MQRNYRQIQHRSLSSNRETQELSMNWPMGSKLIQLTLTVTFMLANVVSDQIPIVAQSQTQHKTSQLPTSPDTGTPTDESRPGGTRTPEGSRNYWNKQILALENNWEGIYEDYFDQDFHSLSLNPDQISQKLAQLNEQTGKRTAVVWMTSQVDGLRLFVVMPNRQPVGTRVVAANRSALSDAIQDFQYQVSTPQSTSTSYLKSAQKLYQWMIAPIEYHLLREDIDTLILCVGPGLRSLPFAALHDGEQFLVEKYELTRIPGFNLTQWHVADLNQADVLAMGASEFEQAEPLPGVPMEISRILSMPWKGVAVLNQDFTLANFKRMREQRDFKIIHLATHAQFNPGSPSNSYIQFRDDQLNLAEMGALSWEDPAVELLTLSACTTALGNVKAELGFVGLAIQSGVTSALGSLWQVSDLGTLALMNEFYWQLKANPLKAEALSQAQIAMIQGEVTLQQGTLQTPRNKITLTPELANLEQMDFSHPYYWASFSLIGNPF